MRNFTIVSWLFILFGTTTLSFASPLAKAACLLPISDGGGKDYMPSKENLWGDIERVELPFVYIKSGKTHEVVKVSLSRIDAVYSVYGGPGKLSLLRPRLQVWVWFENCREPGSGVPNAAYFQFFSADPNDRAALDKDGKITAVPPGPFH
ncbi:MAG TPA: hypothetical protein VIU46_01855 [Gallionellaceae bacterium]